MFKAGDYVIDYEYNIWLLIPDKIYIDNIDYRINESFVNAYAKGVFQLFESSILIEVLNEKN